MIKYCKECNSPFETITSRKYCNDRCYQNHLNSHNRLIVSSHYNSIKKEIQNSLKLDPSISFDCLARRYKTTWKRVYEYAKETKNEKDKNF
jgi:predicted phage-related endonuclease